MNGDARASEGKGRHDRGVRLPKEAELLRPFYCRSCGHEEIGSRVPKGWYALARHTGGLEKVTRLGIYCSLDCLAEQLPRLAGIESKLGRTWDAATARYRQR